MRIRCVTLLCCLLLILGCSAQAESIVDADPTCQVYLNGTEATVIETAVNHRRIWTSRPMLSTSPVVVETTDGPVEVEIKLLNEEATSAVVRPLSLGIEPEVQDGVVRFTADVPAQVVVEFNGQVEGALHLFLNAPEEDAPQEGDENVRWFGPGIHEEREIIPEDGETIYLAQGCILRGSIHATGAKNVTVCGPGIISGSTFDRFADTLVPFDFVECENITIRGVTVLDPSAWTLNLYKCENVTVEDVKIIGARSNSDGITIQSCKHVSVRDCFVRSWDDSLVVKGYDGDVSDITFENVIIWTDLAQSCEIGYETRADVIENITFRDITVLHNFHKPVLSIHNSDNALVQNVLYENIIVEDAQMGEGDGQPFLIDLTTTKSQWSQSKERGNIRNVTIRNLQVLDGKEPSVRIFSFGNDANIDDVTIEGLYILGEHITSFDQLKYNKNNRNGDNIGFAD